MPALVSITTRNFAHVVLTCCSILPGVHGCPLLYLPDRRSSVREVAPGLGVLSADSSQSRTNVCFLLIFVVATIGFSFAGTAFFSLSQGNAAFATTMIVGTGACFFVASCIGWYLLLAAIIEIQEIPIPSLPIFDLSTHVKAKSLVRASKDAKRRS
jgi:hypothetical protein